MVDKITTNRIVVLDTETTGMPVTDGHRVIEIGCVELMGRRLTGRHFHVYLQPDRESDEGAIGVHGITNEFLVGKPRFAEVADEFFEFIKGAQLIIHNAAFDVGFLNNEFALIGQTDRADLTQHCTILDTLAMARAKERYFRLRFVPVVPEKEDEFAISQEDSDEYKKTLSAGVNVMAGYGTIFIVRPKNPRFDTKIEDTPQQYSLRNNGNTVVVVEEFKDCSVRTRRTANPSPRIISWQVAP